MPTRSTGKPPHSQTRLRPDRIDDGARRAELAAAIGDLTAAGVLAHLPSEESMARTRETLAEGWSVVREGSLPNLEALRLLLAFFAWAGTPAGVAGGEGTPPRLAISLAVTTAPEAAPAPPEDSADPSEASSLAVADSHLASLSASPSGDSSPLWEPPC